MGWAKRAAAGPIALAILLGVIPVAGQSAPEKPSIWDQYLPPTHPASGLPFPAGSQKKGPVDPVEFLPFQIISDADRAFVAAHRRQILRSAALEGFDLSEGRWEFEQIRCPVFPGHLLLKYTRAEPGGSASIFTVAIPRGGGPARAIAISRRGNSPYVRASTDAMTISVFNHIREEENSQGTPDWLETGMCYAALAGAEPKLPQAGFSTGGEIMPVNDEAVLEIPLKGGAVIRFFDTSVGPAPRVWRMSFAGDGRLESADCRSSLRMKTTILPPPLTEPRGTPLPPAVTDPAPVAASPLNGKANR